MVNKPSNAVVFQPTTSGETPHQRITTFLKQELGNKCGQLVADSIFEVGRNQGTEAYDNAIRIALKELEKTEEELLSLISLNGN